MSIELFILYCLSRPLEDVEWRSDQPKPRFISTEFVDICLYLFANFLFMKQLIQGLYYDFVYAKAVQTSKFFTVDLSKKPGEKDNKSSYKLSPIRSLLKLAYYYVIDFLIAFTLPCLFGSSLWR